MRADVESHHQYVVAVEASEERGHGHVSGEEANFTVINMPFQVAV